MSTSEGAREASKMPRKIRTARREGSSCAAVVEAVAVPHKMTFVPSHFATGIICRTIAFYRCHENTCEVLCR